MPILETRTTAASLSAPDDNSQSASPRPGKAVLDNSTMRQAISSMLDRCNLTICAPPLDEVFVQRCLDEAARRGCPMDDTPDIPSFRYANIGGAATASITYGYLEDEVVKSYIAQFTSLAIYIEDVYGKRPELVRDFIIKFVTASPQSTAVLEAFAQLLRETPLHFNELQTNLIITSALKFITSIWFEYQREDGLGSCLHQCQVNEGISGQARSKFLYCDCNLPAYTRNLSGAGEAYTMFIFPKDIPFSVYAQAIPSLDDIMTYENDVLSLYKEELAGDAFNCVSVIARHQNITKAETLQHLADRVVTSHLVAAKVVSGCQPAYDAFIHFAQGYVNFHASYQRYRLEELLADSLKDTSMRI